MLKYSIIIALLSSIIYPCIGQDFIYTKGEHFLYFKNKNHKHAVYNTGDIITFNTKDNNNKIIGKIKSFEDSLIVFENFKVNCKLISAIYVDDKTKHWFIFRYKYESAFFLAGSAFLPVDFINSGKIKSDAIIITSGLLGAGLAAKLLISRKLSVNNKRKLLIISY